MIIVLPVIFRNLILADREYVSADNQRIDDFFDSLTISRQERKTTTKKVSIVDEEIEQHVAAQIFNFDPNTISEDSLRLLGLTQKQVSVVCNYRGKGGKFRTAADFAKIYSIDSQTYNRLMPFIKIDSAAFFSQPSQKKELGYVPVIVEINSADSLHLRKIRGIGAVFARRILVYRELLGGFYSVGQLREVYGVTDELYNKILPHITIDSLAIKTINLNIISYEMLKEHPYISDYEAKSIIYYRSKVKMISHPSEILQNKLLPPNKYNKVSPYLVVK